MGNFYTDTLQRDGRFHSAEPIRDMALLEPGFRAQVAAFMAAAKIVGTELIVTETYRSSELQQKYYDEGKTQLRTVGVHHYGLACDFAKLVNGQASWDGDWTFCVSLAKRVSTADRIVISGIDWGRPDQTHSFVDSDHIQGCTIEQQTGLFAGTWYPDGSSTPIVAPVPAPASPAQSTIPAGLTAAQSAALTAFNQVNAQSFAGWFQRSSFMAFCETESNFDPQSYRQEPSGVASYGLLQVLDSTAAGLGLTGDASQMYTPAVGIFYGLKYAAQGWNYLATHFGRPPKLEEWVAGYNEGYGAAAQGRPDQHYVDAWTASRAKWLYLDSAVSPQPVTPVSQPQSEPSNPAPDLRAKLWELYLTMKDEILSNIEDAIEDVLDPSTPPAPPVIPDLKDLQAALGVAADGIFGPATADAIRKHYGG